MTITKEKRGPGRPAKNPLDIKSKLKQGAIVPFYVRMSDRVKTVKDLCLSNGDVSQNWMKFKQAYEIYEIASGISEKQENVKIASFLNAIGEAALDVYNTFDLEEEKKKIYKEVVKAFDLFCNKEKNTVFERYCFLTRKQGVGEPFDGFLLDLRKLARNCKYGDLETSILRDQIIIGVHDKRLRDRLLSDKVEYDKAVEMARTHETSLMQGKHMDGESSGAVHRITHQQDKYNHKYQNSTGGDLRNRINKRKNTFMGSSTKPKQNVFDCKKCRQKHGPQQCPAYKKKCGNCSVIGHFAIVCNRNKKINSININQQNSDHFYIDSIDDDISFRKKCWTEKIRIQDSMVEFKLDTGAEVNALSYDTLMQIDKNTVITPSRSTNIEAYGGGKLDIKGICHLVCIHKNQIELVPFIITVKNLTPIMGIQLLKKFNLIKRVDSMNITNESTSSVDIKCEENLTKDSFIKKYENIFNDLGRFPQTYEIKLQTDASPVINAPRRVAIPIKNKLQKLLNDLEHRKVISKVHEARDWVSSLVIVEKSNGSLRLCLDPKHLNNNVVPEKFLIPTLEDFSSKLIGAKFFSVLDLKDGYWHVELAESSKKLCTFSTPFGNYQFNRMPFGLATAQEIFQKFNQENFGDLNGVVIFIDDILVTGKTEQEHDLNLSKLVERAIELNIKFNKDKLQYKIDKVIYVGFEFSANGMKIDQDRIKTIQEFKDPASRKELESFLGVINFLRPFIVSLSEITYPLRDLLKKDNLFVWTESHSKVVQKIKNEIVNSITLQHFDPNKAITLQTDASQNGIGCCLMQDGKIVSCASRSLSDTEKNYAVIEKEFLAITFACKKFHTYIYGQSVVVKSDHKPLSSIMLKDLSKIQSSKLQRMRLRLYNYKLKVEYSPGKFLFLADFLSRNFLETGNKEEDTTFTETVLSVNMSDEKRELFKRETGNDPVLKDILFYNKNGWPKDSSKIHDHLKFYFKIKSDLFIEDSLIYYENRLLIPTTLISYILKLIHESHLGITKTRARARELFHWLNMNADIENYIMRCDICQKFRKNPTKEILQPHQIPMLPFQKVACDILEFGKKDYLVVMDYYSKWIEIKKISNKSSTEIINKWMEIFATFGTPSEVIADNVPFNSFECRQFAKSWNFEINTSSPLYPKGNGLAERAVAITKDIFNKSTTQEDYYIALGEYRNTPVKDLHFSPAQLLQNRRFQTKLHINKKLLKPSLNQNVEKEFTKKTKNMERFHNRTAIKRESFQNSQIVKFKKIKKGNWVNGTIINVLPNRSFVVRDEEGTDYRRNKSFIVPKLENSGSPENAVSSNETNNRSTFSTRSGKIYTRSL